jgi:hypothetical protein
MPQTPKDAKELFDVMVPAALAKWPDKAKEVNAVFGFRITGPGGGEWTCDLTADTPTCVPGDSGNAQCTIEVSSDDFKTMLTGDASVGMQLYFQQKLKIIGDVLLAQKLQQVLSLAQQ